MNSAPRLLIIAPYFPPRKRVGSLRPYRFASWFLKQGWSVAVIDLATKATLSETESKRLEGLRRFSVKSPIDFTAKSGSAYQERSDKKSSGAEKEARISFIDRMYPVDTWWPLFQLNKRFLINSAKSFKPDMLFSTSDPWSSNWVGYTLSKAFNLPWIADLRDPWMQCTFRNATRPGFIQSVDKAFELKWLSQAKKLTFTAEKTAQKYREAYPEFASKIEVVYNSFDELIEEKSITTQVANNSTSAKLRMVFYGNFRGLSNANILLRTLAEIQKKSSKTLEHLEIWTAGQLSGEDRQAAEAMGLTKLFQQFDFVPQTASRGFLHQFDLLYLSTSVERDDIIPAKLWDYLPVGKPIFAQVPNSEVTNIIDATGTGENFHPMLNIEAAAQKLIEMVRYKLEAELELPIRFNPIQERIKSYGTNIMAQRLENLFIKELR